MHNYATEVVSDQARTPTCPLMLPAHSPIRRRLSAAAGRHGALLWKVVEQPPSVAVLQAAREAAIDSRTADERVVDTVVDRLMLVLTR